MLKKILFGVLICLTLFLVGSYYHEASNSVDNNVYQKFLSGIFRKILTPGNKSYQTWVDGLKSEDKLKLVSMTSEIDVSEVIEKKSSALVMFELRLKFYCFTDSGNKVTVLIDRLGAAITSVNPKTEDDLKETKATKKETKKTINGWDGRIDI